MVVKDGGDSFAWGIKLWFKKSLLPLGHDTILQVLKLFLSRKFLLLVTFT